MIKLKDIKPNPDNPRLIRDEKFTKLLNSIKEFPKMMELRPIVVDNDGMILGGNMRYKALKELGYKEIKKEWVKRADDLTPEEVERFIVVDNVGFGEWDGDLLLNKWSQEELEYWGVEIPEKFLEDIKDEDDFVRRFESIDDENALYPIIPRFDEKNEIFIIVSDSEVDSNYLREILSMQKMGSYKNDEVSKSNVIHIKDVINAMQNSDSLV